MPDIVAGDRIDGGRKPVFAACDLECPLMNDSSESLKVGPRFYKCLGQLGQGQVQTGLAEQTQRIALSFSDVEKNAGELTGRGAEGSNVVEFTQLG